MQHFDVRQTEDGTVEIVPQMSYRVPIFQWERAQEMLRDGLKNEIGKALFGDALFLLGVHPEQQGVTNAN